MRTRFENVLLVAMEMLLYDSLQHLHFKQVTKMKDYMQLKCYLKMIKVLRLGLYFVEILAADQMKFKQKRISDVSCIAHPGLKCDYTD